MQVALTLHYLPPENGAPPVPIWTLADPDMLLAFRRRVLEDRAERCDHAADPVQQLIAQSDLERIRGLLNVLIPDEPSP